MPNKKITLSIDKDVYDLMKEMASDFNLKNPHKTTSNTSEYAYKYIVEESIKNLYELYKNTKSTNNSLDRLSNESSIRKTLNSMKIKIAVPRGKSLSDIVKISEENNQTSRIKVKCIKCEKWKAIDEIIKDCPKNREINWKYFRNCCKNHRNLL